MESPQSMAELGELVRSGFDDWRSLGEIYTQRGEGLILFNYTIQAAAMNRWNWLERVSRGLILDAQTGEVVARPFDKFFNWHEGGRETDANLKRVTKKIDGSLGIMFVHKNRLRIATRGSLDSEQARWATRWFYLNGRATYKMFERPHTTYLFEIVYPENQIIVDYGDLQTMVLLAARDNSGEYADYETVKSLAIGMGVPYVESVIVNSIRDIELACIRLSVNEEGFVAEFEDGQRFKFKSYEYAMAQINIASMTWNIAAKIVAADTGNGREKIRNVPAKYMVPFEAMMDFIENKVGVRTAEIRGIFGQAPFNNRKEFAKWATTEHNDIASYLFAMLDGRGIRTELIKNESRAWKEEYGAR